MAEEGGESVRDRNGDRNGDGNGVGNGVGNGDGNGEGDIEKSSVTHAEAPLKVPLKAALTLFNGHLPLPLCVETAPAVYILRRQEATSRTYPKGFDP